MAQVEVKPLDCGFDFSRDVVGDVWKGDHVNGSGRRCWLHLFWLANTKPEDGQRSGLGEALIWKVHPVQGLGFYADVAVLVLDGCATVSVGDVDGKASLCWDSGDLNPRNLPRHQLTDGAVKRVIVRQDDGPDRCGLNLRTLLRASIQAAGSCIGSS